MAYVTELEGALVSFDELGVPNVIDLSDTSVLNNFGTSSEITGYNVQDDGDAATVENGDFITTTTAEGSITGTYAGNGVLTNTTLSLGSMTDSGFGGALATGLQVSLNPISVDYFVDGDGNVYTISDEPLDSEHLMATISVNLPGNGNLASLSVPVSELTSALGDLDPTGLLGGLLSSVGNLSQFVMNTAIIDTTFDSSGSLTLPDGTYDIVCFAEGTLIETEAGPVAVEMLKLGDLVVTRDHGLQPIRWIGSKRLGRSILQAVPRLLPIRIRAGALAPNVPARDLLVSPQHRILVRSKIAIKMFGALEVLIPAKQLLQLDGIDIATDVESVKYFHILFDAHEVVISNGAETESMYTGPEALKAVGRAAREEILTLFPQLRADRPRPAARPLPSGHGARKLVVRHRQHDRDLVG